MRKISGILVLLLMALLISLPATADVLWAPDSLIELVTAGNEIKTEVREEVTAYSGEKLAIPAAPTIPVVLQAQILEMADTGAEVDNIEAAITTADIREATAGGIRLNAGGLPSGPQMRA